MTYDKIYQVVYSLETKCDIGEVWWDIWYLLKCPLVGFGSLTEARERAMEWKDQLGIKFQPVIIGDSEGDFERIDIASLFGISAIGGLDAGEFELPDFLLEESEGL